MSSNGFKVSLESYFKLDIDRLLSSDSSSEEETHEKSKSEEVLDNHIRNEPQNVQGENSYEKHNLFDVAEFEKSEGNFVRQMEAKKMLLIEFIERTTGIYATKFGELIRKQEAEKDEFKREFVRNVKCELEKWQKLVSYVRQEEEKLVKLLDHLRKLYNSPEVQNGRLRKIADMHKVFFQKYEEIITKHKCEVKSLKAVINEEVTRVKRNLSREYMKKESKLIKNQYSILSSSGNSSF